MSTPFTLSPQLGSADAGPVVVIGLGVAGRAVARALRDRSIAVIAAEDAATEDHRALAAEVGVALLESPSETELSVAIAGAVAVVPSPGVPHSHPCFALADASSVPVISEFDLAQLWDHRPLLAITGTDGKTTVTTMVTEMLRADGRNAVDAGNTDVPLVEAIDDPATEVFVVEASSFRLGRAQRFSPRVATWLNWGPDHLDVHATLEEYEQAKARIWADLDTDAVAVLNLDDPVVARNRPGGTVWTFSTTQPADYELRRGADGPELWGRGERLLAVSELARRLPHDLSNALAAAATAEAYGAARPAVVSVLRSFSGLAHRVQEVATHGGITFVNDSKATVPHAVAAAVRSYDAVVLIAGGRNKGLDLNELTAEVASIRAVVAIGDSASEVEAAFADLVPVAVATSMDDAVRRAAEQATAGETVLLSPGCASFDWYENYGARGDDFIRAVTEYIAARRATEAAGACS
ncbi:MAG: UDP-N-acetylmuramoyl-L-alanine--D-glutamate ligase [Acidimicrobiales bacterium]|nr:UDP-N-acetylmuramoyl-L-alanine--D-glutamate ligase [Acidimicrobiales bacterium]